MEHLVQQWEADQESTKRWVWKLKYLRESKGNLACESEHPGTYTSSSQAPVPSLNSISALRGLYVYTSETIHRNSVGRRYYFTPKTIAVKDEEKLVNVLLEKSGDFAESFSPKARKNIFEVCER